VPQHSIAALADLSRPVDFARLIHARCQAEVRADRFRGAEAAGSSTVAMYARAVTGPTPGIVIRRGPTSERRVERSRSEPRTSGSVRLCTPRSHRPVITSRVLSLIPRGSGVRGRRAMGRWPAQRCAIPRLGTMAARRTSNRRLN
jgi:hypothetical protein